MSGLKAELCTPSVLTMQKIIKYWMMTKVRNQESGARRDVLKDQTFGPKIRYVIRNNI